MFFKPQTRCIIRYAPISRACQLPCESTDCGYRSLLYLESIGDQKRADTSSRLWGRSSCSRQRMHCIMRHENLFPPRSVRKLAHLTLCSETENGYIKLCSTQQTPPSRCMALRSKWRGRSVCACVCAVEEYCVLEARCICSRLFVTRHGR